MIFLHLTLAIATGCSRPDPKPATVRFDYPRGQVENREFQFEADGYRVFPSEIHIEPSRRLGVFGVRAVLPAVRDWTTVRVRACVPHSRYRERVTDRERCSDWSGIAPGI